MFLSVLMFNVVLVFITVVSLVTGKQLNIGFCCVCCLSDLMPCLVCAEYSFVTYLDSCL